MSFYPYSIFPLGDSALIIDFGNKIDEDMNQKVLELFCQLKNCSHPFITDLIPAYSSLAVYYDICSVFQKKAEDKSAFETMVAVVEELLSRKQQGVQTQKRRM